MSENQRAHHKSHESRPLVLNCADYTQSLPRQYVDREAVSGWPFTRTQPLHTHRRKRKYPPNWPFVG